MTVPIDDFPRGDEDDAAQVEQTLADDSFNPSAADFDAENDPEGCS